MRSEAVFCPLFTKGEKKFPSFFFARQKRRRKKQLSLSLSRFPSPQPHPTLYILHMLTRSLANALARKREEQTEKREKDWFFPNENGGVDITPVCLFFLSFFFVFMK